MESSNNQLVRHQSGNFGADTSSPYIDQSLSTTQAGLQPDRTDAHVQSDQLEQVDQKSSEVAVQAMQPYQTDNKQSPQKAITDTSTETARYSRLERVDSGTSEFAVQAVQVYRTDMNRHNDRLERVVNGAMGLAAQENMTCRANMKEHGDRLERVVNAAMATASQAVQKAHETVATCEMTSQAALSANKDVSLAAIATARQGTESLEKIALDAHSMTREILQSTSAEAKSRSEEERKTKRDEQIGELRQQLADWRMLMHPNITQETMVGIALTKIAHLTYMEKRLAEQKQMEINQEEANRRLAADTLRSRTEKINIAKAAIEHSLTSLDNNELNLPLLLSCALVVCFASYYFGGGKTASIALISGCAMVVAIGSYRTVSYWSDLSNRKKWLGIYIRALERLSIEPRLTVRSAVQEILNSDLSIDNEHKNSTFTKQILGQIKDEPVTGDPAEVAPTIPSVLAFLVDHGTRQSIKSFSKL